MAFKELELQIAREFLKACFEIPKNKKDGHLAINMHKLGKHKFLLVANALNSFFIVNEIEVEYAIKAMQLILEFLQSDDYKNSKAKQDSEESIPQFSVKKPENS